MSGLDFTSILWDPEDDFSGNVQHIARHGLSTEDVEKVLENPTDMDISRSSGRTVVFGDTGEGRHIMVVYEMTGDTTVYPITAFDVPRREYL